MANAVFGTVPAKLDYLVYQGDTWTPGSIIATQSGVPINFTGWSAKMEVRSTTSGDLVLTFATTPAAGQGLITLSSIGAITPSLTDVQSAAVATGDYKCDLQMTSPTAAKTTYTNGTFTVTSDVTQNF